MDAAMRPENAAPISRNSILELMNGKDKIEKEIAALTEVLSSNRVGMHDPLVDGEGYPRQDIDVYQVRHARHRIICLQNDHKNLMREIEESLYTLHSSSGRDEAMEETPCHIGDPIAVVNKVTPGSPSDLAGLAVNDKIIQFGSVNSSNFQSLKNIVFVAESSVNRPVAVVILRDKRMVQIALTPKLWSGPGLLGCNLCDVAPENVDR